MAVMMRHLYQALRAAGASEEDAAEAAEEVAGFQDRLPGFELRLAKMERDLNLLIWMLGFNLAFSVAIAVKLFAP